MAERIESATARALIADDDEFFRIALKSILCTKLGLQHVAETASLDEAIDALGRSQTPDIALFDLAMPGVDGPFSLGAVRELFPEMRVVVISASKRRRDIIDALIAGVHGYIPKGNGIESLTEAIRLIMDGLIYVPPSLADVAAGVPPSATDEFKKDTKALPHEKPTLTPRQWDVLNLLVQGRSNKEIARALDLGEGTVKIHLAALFRNLQVRNRASAAVVGARHLQDHEKKLYS